MLGVDDTRFEDSDGAMRICQGLQSPGGGKRDGRERNEVSGRAERAVHNLDSTQFTMDGRSWSTVDAATAAGSSRAPVQWGGVTVGTSHGKSTGQLQRV
ncbi:hypothetical protein ACRE_033600 [Hapsidospora chrysogenum ATCC 11550]|uniref:Uncharacterized protein n=1 Tax=Hapsidospora chrysogenum (strain ATCC 11550 / CBS 779.69 / DSM 880 / IAM 14645 / JCM 23072 / IMI 49137) TaxID=857340 RepID=A0A086T8W6_HAPC1|nr:hypothetical protein ACRE_033600 [Hapsidospora chrysogenum ATCC 11550]